MNKIWSFTATVVAGASRSAERELMLARVAFGAQGHSDSPFFHPH